MSTSYSNVWVHFCSIAYAELFHRPYGIYSRYSASIREIRIGGTFPQEEDCANRLYDIKANEPLPVSDFQVRIFTLNKSRLSSSKIIIIDIKLTVLRGYWHTSIIQQFTLIDRSLLLSERRKHLPGTSRLILALSKNEWESSFRKPHTPSYQHHRQDGDHLTQAGIFRSDPNLHERTSSQSDSE